MIHPVGVIYYDPFWLYAAVLFAFACVVSLMWWSKWMLEYFMSHPREYLAHELWMRAQQWKRRRARVYWRLLVVSAFGGFVCLAFYIFQH